MKFSISQQKPNQANIEVLGVFIPEQKKAVETALVDFPASLKKEILSLAKKSKFIGKESQVLVVATYGKITAPLVMLVGIGKTEEDQAEQIRQAAATFIKAAKKYHAKKVGLVGAKYAQAVAEGALIGSYVFNKYKKSKEENTTVNQVVVFGPTSFKGELQRGIAISKGVKLARDLVNEPADAMTPKDLARIASKIAKLSPQITLKTLNKHQLYRQGFGGILAVAKGSSHEPYLIHLIYKPVKKSSKKIALVGKGITFDSGGISLKPTGHIETMKTDMAGAATILGIFSILSKLKPNVEMHGLAPVCENMPSGSALKPGDIIRIKNKKTVEVLNTDAEGRLILADALSYAQLQKYDTVIDIATLTGACMAALGQDIAGIMGNNRGIINAIIDAAKSAGEKLWQMPLEKKYKETLKSDIADLRNISTIKYAGAITAGLFLQEFVGKDKWAHIDIAGPSYFEKPYNAYLGKGASGFGVRTLVEYLKTVQ